MARTKDGALLELGTADTRQRLTPEQRARFVRLVAASQRMFTFDGMIASFGVESLCGAFLKTDIDDEPGSSKWFAKSVLEGVGLVRTEISTGDPARAAAAGFHAGYHLARMVAAGVKEEKRARAKKAGQARGMQAAATAKRSAEALELAKFQRRYALSDELQSEYRSAPMYAYDSLRKNAPKKAPSLRTIQRRMKP